MWLASITVVGLRNIVLLIEGPKKFWKEQVFDTILFAKVRPIFVKYLQNPLAISIGSEIVLPSNLKEDGKVNCLAILLIIDNFIY